MSNGLSGKVCIVTGTGGGIGREAALTFAREGALVVGCGLYVDDAEATLAAVRAAGGTIVSMQPCDLTKPADCQALVDFAVRTFGRIDVLFNNAALAYFNWLEDISDEEWDRNRRSEVDLVFYLTRAAWAYLKASRGLVVNRDWARCLAILGLCLFVTAGLQAQTPDPTPLDAPQPGVRPPLSPFPRFEDWSFLRDPSLRVDPYDRLKFIPLNDSKTNYLTFGLESRTEFQYLSNNNWGAGPQNPGVVLERLMPDIDLRLGDHVRVFVTLTFDEFTGQYPRPGIDKDIADGHEGFVEFGSNLHDPHPGWDVIAGRQEIVLGTGRLLDDNEGVNVRSAFDGVRVGYDKPKGRIDLIAVKPVEINPGAWDDISNPTITLWGLYASNLRWSPQFMSDVYFLDYDAKSAIYGNQSAREQRRTIAGRYFNRLPGEPPRAGFDYNVETGFQWGSFGNRSIRAWGAGGNIGWTLPGPIWRARFALQADALSGDKGQPDTLGTFNALFPRGAYFGPKFALIGPANLLAVQPQFWFHPLQNVTGDLCWIWFWRESTNDALYSFENVQLRPANLSNGRYIGSQPNLEIRWAISEHFLAALNLAGSMAGTFLQQSPPSKSIVFVNIGLTYRF